MNIVIAGHVDHGKSTLLGRLLFDTKCVDKNRIELIKKRCEESDLPFQYSFLIDALKSEKSKKITIDAARISFRSTKRNYKIIDTPGHSEFIKNMVSGAAQAEAAIIVIDALEGIQENTLRHLNILNFIGIKQICVVINKIDLLEYKQEIFEKIKCAILNQANSVKFDKIHFIPVSAYKGDNVVEKSPKMEWYKESTLLETLDSFLEVQPSESQPFRMFVQDIYDEFKLAGLIISGSVKKGNQVIIYPTLKAANITNLISWPNSNVESFALNENATLQLYPQLQVERGYLLTNINEKQPRLSHEANANIFVFQNESLAEGDELYFKLQTFESRVVISKIISIYDSSLLIPQEHSNRAGPLALIKVQLKSQQPIYLEDCSDLDVMKKFVLMRNNLIIAAGTLDS